MTKKVFHVRKAKHGKEKKYFFTDLKIDGEPDEFPIKDYDRVRCMASLIGTRNNMKFVTRKEGKKVYVYRVG